MNTINNILEVTNLWFYINFPTVILMLIEIGRDR